mmetsp:Transcript_23743/g.73090  ORF Transcript_23743/g.73090 Transcript_23743/m.73090 type:complete len:359 (-) Transcript_23743:714-1790(-)
MTVVGRSFARSFVRSFVRARGGSILAARKWCQKRKEKRQRSRQGPTDSECQARPSRRLHRRRRFVDLGGVVVVFARGGRVGVVVVVLAGRRREAGCVVVGELAAVPVGAVLADEGEGGLGVAGAGEELGGGGGEPAIVFVGRGVEGGLAAEDFDLEVAELVHVGGVRGGAVADTLEPVEGVAEPAGGAVAAVLDLVGEHGRGRAGHAALAVDEDALLGLPGVFDEGRDGLEVRRHLVVFLVRARARQVADLARLSGGGGGGAPGTLGAVVVGEFAVQGGGGGAREGAPRRREVVVQREIRREREVLALAVDVHVVAAVVLKGLARRRVVALLFVGQVFVEVVGVGGRHVDDVADLFLE